MIFALESHMSLPTDKIKEGHRVYSHIAKLQELWETTQVQTIQIPKSMADSSFLKVRPEFKIKIFYSCQKKYYSCLCEGQRKTSGNHYSPSTWGADSGCHVFFPAEPCCQPLKCF